MTKETTNTSGYELKPTGHYVFEVEKVVKKSIGKEGGKQYPGYEWTFDIRFCEHQLEDNNFKTFMFKSQMEELLRALGASEPKKGIFEWDTDEVNGKVVACELVHVDINGTLREQLIEVVPYKEGAEVSPASSEQKAWDD